MSQLSWDCDLAAILLLASAAHPEGSPYLSPLQISLEIR